MENKKYHIIPEEWLKEKYNSAKKLSDEGGIGALFDDGELSVIEDIQQSFPSEEINKQEQRNVLIDEIISKITQLTFRHCSDHTPYRGACVTCGNVSNWDVLPDPEDVINELEQMKQG